MDPWKIHTYSLASYPFPLWVAESLRTNDLDRLSADEPRWKEREDQRSPWHRDFYAKFPDWQFLYRDFVKQVIAPIVGEPFYFQAVPTFRVHLPGNVAVGAFHTDAMYHHPMDETSYWLPVTHASATRSVWIEDDEGALRAPNVWPGELVAFSATTRLHGNITNITGRSRVSFDFRCIPVRLLPKEEGPPSENMNLRFVPGGYYDAEVVRP